MGFCDSESSMPSMCPEFIRLCRLKQRLHRTSQPNMSLFIKHDITTKVALKKAA